MGDNPRSLALRRQRQRARQAGAVSYAGAGAVLGTQVAFPGMESPTIDSPSDQHERDLRDANARVLETTRARIAAERDYADARREFARALQQDIRDAADEDRALFRSAKRELDRQRAEVRRLAGEAEANLRFLRGEVSELQRRIAEAAKHSPYELGMLREQLQALQGPLADAAREQGACRSELKLITDDLKVLARSKHFADRHREEYVAELRELKHRSEASLAYDLEWARSEAQWDRDYGRRSAEEDHEFESRFERDLGSAEGWQ